MKILYILNCFPELSETFILNEITGLVDLGHEVDVISLSKPREGKAHQEVKEYNLINKTEYLWLCSKVQKYAYYREIFKKAVKELFLSRVLTIKRKLQLFGLCYAEKSSRKTAMRCFLDCLSIINLIDKKKIKIEHIQCHFARYNVKIIYIIHQFLGIPYTFTTHAVDIFVNPDKEIKKWSENAKDIIAISDFNKNYLHNNFAIPLDKIKIVYCSIYVDKIKPVERYRQEPFKIISVSRLVEKKGYPYLVKACRILKDKGMAFSCEIYGEGPLRPEIEALIKENNLEKEIKLGGAITREEAFNFMERGSVFVLPCIRAGNNDMDGIPNVLMEAMATEIPVISTGISGIPELIDSGIDGILVSPKDAIALSGAMIKIRNDPDFAEKIRKKGRLKVKEKFNVERNIRRLVEIFQR